MDNGVALIIASIVPTLTAAAVGALNEWRAKRIARELKEHNEEVARKLAANTAITEATHEEVTVIKKALNGDVK